MLIRFTFIGVFYFIAYLTISVKAHAVVGNIQSIREIYRSIEDDIVTKSNESNCTEQLSQKSKVLDSLSSQLLENIADVSSTEKITEVINESWLLRIKLFEKLRSIDQGQNLSKECVISYAHLLNSLRAVEDHYGNSAVKKTKNMSKTAFQGDEVSLLSNPKYGKFDYQKDFKSGDIIMSRGNTFVSAAIARGNGFNGQFSHLSLVYVDEKTNKAYTIESHIEDGVLLRPIEEHIKQENSREVVLRYSDSQVAAQAAKYMYDLVRKYKEPKTIPYDFERLMDDHSAVDCTEVIRMAYEKVTNRKVLFPMHISSFPSNLSKFLKRTGVKSKIAFMPVDIEVDTRLEIVAEWRNFNNLDDVYYKNEIVSSMYKWIGEKNYEFKTNLEIFLKKNIAWHLRHWPFYLLQSKFPLTMTKEFIGNGLAMDEVGNIMYEQLSNEIKSKNISLLTATELSKLIESLRLKDKKEFIGKAYRSSENGYVPWPYHEFFRAEQD